VFSKVARLVSSGVTVNFVKTLGLSNVARLMIGGDTVNRCFNHVDSVKWPDWGSAATQ